MNITFLSHHKAIIAGSVVVAGIAVGAVFLQKPESAKQAGGVYIVAPADITEQVDAGGTVVPAKSVNLAFDHGGRIALVNTAVGDSVYGGETLVTLDASDLVASRAQAEAAVQAAQANLAGLNQGAKPAQVAVYQTTLSGARDGAVAAIKAAYATADDAVRNKAYALFSNPESGSPSFNLTLSDTQLKINIESDQVTINKELTDWSDAVANLTSAGDIDAQISGSEHALNDAGAFLDLVNQALSVAVPTVSVPQTSIDAYKASIGAARSAVSGASQSVTAAGTALSTAEKNLTFIQSPGTSDQISAAEAAVSEAQASVQNIDAQIGKTIISAPFAGIVTEVDAKAGQVAGPSVPLVSLISNGKFQMEVYVSQVDIGKVKAGDLASVGLDAYPGQVFSAAVITVAPAPVQMTPDGAAASGSETVTGPSAAYKVTLQFDNDDARIKAGLSGNALITTEQKTNILAVPSDSIILRGTDTYVMMSASGTSPVLTKVTTGISGQGLTEITGGLASGDGIISFTSAASSNK